MTTAGAFRHRYHFFMLAIELPAFSLSFQPPEHAMMPASFLASSPHAGLSHGLIADFAPPRVDIRALPFDT